MFLWFKAFHLIAMVAWMAGLFYLPRLFVYHCKAQIGGPVSEQFKIMERRLLKAIVWPAGIATWLFGALTAYTGGYFEQRAAWLEIKIVLVLGLVAFHVMLGKYVQAFAKDLRPRPERYFRILNEVPTVLLAGIVILAVVRPV
ncbi:protoporphyrinogen oxidase HemJ [Aestuariivirga sp.]|uniref:protoporphyrinogen oxidase HemJ n=1 Tax=Aestuariivirga sp. TaxID=2650926 RepID=UPI0039E6AFA3